MTIFPKLLSFGFAFLAGGVIGGEVRITSVDDFIQFKNNVNSGTNYFGTTVFLDSDINLAEKTFEPIGTKYPNYFTGVFDGQGHVIRNLKITSSLESVGLFGSSAGLTIKNVILDSSCSVATAYGSYYARIGGFIGQCNSGSGPCAIENSVNMGSVIFSEDTSFGDPLSLGGFAGRIDHSSHDVILKNCANYGEVTGLGKSGHSDIGGIVGTIRNYYPTDKGYIYNCINYGAIKHKCTSGVSSYIGGIAGDAWYTTIENCVSGGMISFLNTPSKWDYIGSVVGYSDHDLSVNYTYFRSELSGYKVCAYEFSPSSIINTLSYDTTSFELNDTVSIGIYTSTSLVGALNAYANYKDSGYSHWLLNKGKNTVSFTINGKSTFKMNYQVILLPDPVSDAKMKFKGWYTDEECTIAFLRATVTADTALYGKYGRNTK